VPFGVLPKPGRSDDQTLDLAVLVLGDEEQVNQRTDVGGSSRPEARLRLVGAVLVEIHDEWQVGERRYLSEGSMALLIKPPASSEGLATPALLKA